MAFLYDGPCILIGGAARSGTTLLGEVLAQHPHAAVLLEERLTDVVLAVERLCSIRTPAEEEDRTAIFGGPRSFLSYPLTVGEGDVAKLAATAAYRRRFATLLTQVFEGATSRRSPVVLASKLPIGLQWEDLDLLAQRLGDLRLILIVRNPLDVVSSSLVRGRSAREGRDEWPVHDVAAACTHWVSAMRKMRRIAQAPPGPLLLVKYEDLCTRPLAEEARILKFASLEIDESALEVVTRPCPPSRSGLSADDRAHLHAELGDVDADWPHLTARQTLDRYADLAGAILAGAPAPLGVEGGESVLASGFSFPEGWGRWTDGPRAVLRFRPLGCAAGARLNLHVALSWIPPGEDATPLRVSINGEPPAPRRIRAGEALAIDLSPQHLSSGVVSITLDIAHPKTPLEPPLEDPRALGVALSGLDLHPA